MELRIYDWDFDEDNLSELAKHGVTATIVRQVGKGKPKFRGNKKDRAATHQMIGPDSGGGFWTICIIEKDSSSGLWRPITGWASESQEIAWHRRK